jgi:hypothetical protein
MSAEVRVCFEIGTTDGDTAVRVLVNESVLRPTLGQTTSTDYALLVRTALERLASEGLERALEQADIFTAAMASAADAIPLVPLSEGGAEQGQFLATIPEPIRASKHFEDVVAVAAEDTLPLGNVTRELIVAEVRRREAVDPS